MVISPEFLKGIFASGITGQFVGEICRQLKKLTTNSSDFLQGWDVSVAKKHLISVQIRIKIRIKDF